MPEDHHSANPERGALLRATAEILKHGITLVNADVAEIMPYYGYEASTGYASGIMANHVSHEVLAAQGVELVIGTYRGRKMYWDGQLDLADTDIEKAKQKIDSLLPERAEVSELRTAKVEKTPRRNALTVEEQLENLTGDPTRRLTTAEVAFLFQVSPRTVTDWASKGRISSILTPGGHRRYSAKEVKRLLDASYGEDLPKPE